MSLQAQHDPKNETEITYWNSAGGRRWITRKIPGHRPGPDSAGNAGAICSRCEQLTKFRASRCEGDPLGHVIE
jgi:hypothetical protein